MSQLYTEQAKRRAEELASPIKSSSSMAMLPAMSLTRRSVWQPVSVPLGSPGRRRHHRASFAEPAHRRNHPHRRALLEAVTADGRCCQGVSCQLNLRLSHASRNFSHLSVTLATTSLKWFWLTKTAGTDTRRPNGSPCAMA